jgi:hypothetical protein
MAPTPHPARVTHLDGTPWHSTPLPTADHTCWPHTSHTDPNGTVWLDRCPCGAARTTSDWFHRNSRATGRVLSPSVIRLVTAQVQRRATQHERQATMTTTRQVMQCTYLTPSGFVPAGARAYIARINPATGNDRILLLVRAPNGRWAQRWESTDRLGRFRLTTLPPGHAHHGDTRIRDFTTSGAAAFLATVQPTLTPHANPAAAMARVHAGGAR